MHGIYSGTLLSIVVPDKRRTLSNARFYSNLVSCPRIRILSLRSKWAAGKARGGRISRSIRNRRATQPPAHFQRNPPGRGQLAVFPRCSLDPYESRYGRFARLEKQPTDLRRRHHYMRDGALERSCSSGEPQLIWACSTPIEPSARSSLR